MLHLYKVVVVGIQHPHLCKYATTSEQLRDGALNAMMISSFGGRGIIICPQMKSHMITCEQDLMQRPRCVSLLLVSVTCETRPKKASVGSFFFGLCVLLCGKRRRSAQRTGQCAIRIPEDRVGGG